MTLTVKTMELHGKVQKWIDSIMSDKLETVATESKSLEDWDQDPKLNKLIFKALLCLSHTSERSKPSQTQTGKHIFDIADNLCYSLTEIPDLIKYYCSLYHIVRKLIAMELYSEAMRVTTWTFPSNNVRISTSKHMDMYLKIAYLWHEPAVDLLNTLPGSLPRNGLKLVLEFLSNELKVLEVIAKERPAYVLSRVLRYLIKLDTVIPNFKVENNQSHRSIVRNFFAKLRLAPVGEEKYEVYCDALRFVNSATNAAVDGESGENALAVFSESCEILEVIFRDDQELNGCFLVYKNMGVMLLESVYKLDKIPHWDVKTIRKETLDIIESFREGKGVSWNMRMIGYILQSLFQHWDHCFSIKDEGFLEGEVLREILGLMKLMFLVLNSIRTKGCEICTENGCRMEKNTHSVTVVSIRGLLMLSKVSAPDLLKDLFPLIRELLEENVAAIFEMKEAGCAQWAALWSNCGINIYNLSVTCHKIFYEEAAFLFSLLCSCIVRFEGVGVVNSKINIKNPLSYVLHRLSSVHFNHGNYREALTPCALNGLLSYQNPDSKAFRMWASIKHACANNEAVLRMTMLSCLKEDMSVISDIGVDIRLCDYNLNQLCIQELRGLHEARCNLSLSMLSTLDELQNLNSGGLEYTQGVHLLGYHLLNYQYDENFPRYLKRATRKLKADKFPGDLHILAAASLDFYAFVMNLHKTIDQTKTEMESTKFTLRASKSTSHEDPPKNNETDVPAFSRINISEDSKLFSSLQQALNKWSICVENKTIRLVEEWYLVLTLRTLVIVGEYSRLHKFTTLEITAWELAYKVASELKDSRTCVHIIGRSTSLRNVNSEWIKTGNELTTALKSSSEPEADNAIAFFWASLSNLYFEIGKHKEAAEILQRVMALPNISPFKNVPGYLSSLDTVLRNYRFCSDDSQGTNYMVYIVRCLYALVSLMEYLPLPRVGTKEKQLHSSEVLFTCTSHMALSMNSLLSFKEISSHLMNRLKLSHASGVTLRSAECLKNLCFIDLSRMQLDDCLIKVQALEFILRTEYIEESKNTKNPETSTNELDKPGARDTRVNDTSPLLRNTVFKSPAFISHEKCNCYKCCSVDYQYLVLSGTHIRAKLYFLQGHLDEAQEHFNGAFLLRRKMLQIEKIKWDNNSGGQHPWKDYHHTVEYVLLLLDFSRFIRELEYDDAIDVAVQAVDICERFNLQSHTIYTAARELVLEYQFCKTFEEADFSKFTVPDASSIDISRFTHVAITLDSAIIATPASRPLLKKPKTIRRNKTPPLLKLTKVNLNLSDDEDEGGSESPKSSRQRSKAGKNNRRVKSVTRKKLQEYLEDPGETAQLKVTVEAIPAQTVSQIVTQAASLRPNLSEKLAEVLDKPEMNEREKIQRVIDLVEQLGTNAEPKTETLERGRRGRSKNSLISKSNTDQEDLDKLVSSFKDILIGSRDGRFLQNADEASSLLPTGSMNDLDPSFGDYERGSTIDVQGTEALSIGKKVGKKLEFLEFPEGTLSGTDIKESKTKFPKPEYGHGTERLRTSDRIKRSRSQSSEVRQNKSEEVSNLEEKEKPKISARRRIGGLQAGSEGVLALGNGKMEKKVKDNKEKPRNLRRVERSQSEMSSAASSSFEVIESSGLEDSDIIESSVIEERVRRNFDLCKYKTRTSSRIARSQSQLNGTSSKSKIVDNSDSVSTSDPEELEESNKCKNGGRQKSKSKASSSNQEEQKLTVFKETGAVGKKQAHKRPNSGRSKLKR